MSDVLERIMPIFNRVEHYRSWGMDKAVILVMIILIPFLVFVLQTDTPFFIFLCAAIPLFFFIFLPVSTMKERLAEGLNAKEKFLRGQSQTTANILRRFTKDVSVDPGEEHLAHYILLEFIPDQATVSTNLVQFQAVISEVLFEKLAGRKSVGITYAVEDPRIFILDGENVPGWERT